jgi:hypothetical protein
MAAESGRAFESTDLVDSPTDSEAPSGPDGRKSTEVEYLEAAGPIESPKDRDAWYVTESQNGMVDVSSWVVAGLRDRCGCEIRSAAVTTVPLAPMSDVPPDVQDAPSRTVAEKALDRAGSHVGPIPGVPTRLLVATRAE